MVQQLKSKMKSPQISRFLTAVNWLGIFTMAMLSITISLFILNLGFLGWIFWENEQAKNKLLKERQKWDKIVTEYQDYRDGYFQLALIEYRLNNKEKSKEYLEKTLTIDPNFEPAKELERMLASF